MTRRVGGLVEVDHTGVDVRFQVTLERRAASGNWGKMSRPDKNFKQEEISQMFFEMVQRVDATRLPGLPEKHLRCS